jgi:hypothetical protein
VRAALRPQSPPSPPSNGVQSESAAHVQSGTAEARSRSVSRSEPRSLPRIVQFARVDALTEPESLSELLGPVAHVARVPLLSPGKSGASLERLEITLRSGQPLTLIHKHSRLPQDWVRLRTADLVGREAALLGQPLLAGVWDELVCPYRAFAVGNGDVGLLMEDLSEVLVQLEVPLSTALEDTVLNALARLHARFWGSAALTLPWLATPATSVRVFGGNDGADLEAAGMADLAQWVRTGWRLLRERLSPAVYELLEAPVAPLARLCAGIPSTLLHGDTRLANMAVMPKDPVRPVAFLDWQMAGAGPATLDLGLYLAGNARLRSRGPEALIAHYRELLERALAPSASSALPGSPVEDAIWERMVAAGTLYGAALLLWDRALDADDMLPGAAAELEWWSDQLERLVASQRLIA